MHRRKEVPFLIGKLGRFVEERTDFQMLSVTISSEMSQ